MLRLSLLLVFLPVIADAETYHLASCQFFKDHGQWALALAMSNHFEANRGEQRVIGAGGDGTGNFCNLLEGSGDPAEANVKVHAAEGEGLTNAPLCKFEGRVTRRMSTRSNLRFGQYVKVEYDSYAGSTLNAAYFASPEEAATPAWSEKACRKIGDEMNRPSPFSARETVCHLPEDQGMGSLHGQWDQLPIRLVFDRAFYENGGAEARALKRAVRTWNRWGAGNGLVLFQLVNDGTGAEIPHTYECAQPMYTAIFDHEMPRTVGVWKINGRGFRANRRPTCGTDSSGTMGKILPYAVQGQTDWRQSAGGKINAANVLLNFDDYNGPGKTAIDVESTMLHELGHVLGLLHSCNGSDGRNVDSTTAPACFTGGRFTAPEEYLDAAMFPFLESGETKRVLGENDLARASCLYPGR